jgi:hypothetical protein
LSTVVKNSKIQKQLSIFQKNTICGALLLLAVLMYVSIDYKYHQNHLFDKAFAVANADKKLILFQGYQGMNAAYASTHRAEIDALPFDGITFMPDTNLALTTFSNTPHSVAEYKNAMSGMNSTNFSHTNHNFAVVFVGTPGNSTDWSTASNNMANLAEAAKLYNLDGIFFDVEQYDTADAWLPASCPGQTDTVCKNNLYNAGKQAMQMMVSRWPNVKIIASHGISVGDPKSEAYLASAYTPCQHRDWSNALENQVRSYYEMGLLEGTVGNSATYIDGGEDYDIHSEAAAQRFYNWRKTVEGQQSDIVPNSLRSNWTSKIGLSFGTQDDVWCQSSGLQGNATAADWKKDLLSTLKYTDEYVWAFARNHRWYNDSDGRFPHVTQDFINATLEVRSIIGLDAVSTPVASPPPTTPPVTSPSATPKTNSSQTPATSTTTSQATPAKPAQGTNSAISPSQSKTTATSPSSKVSPKTIAKTATNIPSNSGKIALIAGGSLALLGTCATFINILLRKVIK